MRPFYILVGVIALGIGVAGWATLGTAQTGPTPIPPGGRPARVDFPATKPTPKPRPDDDLFDLPSPPRPPVKDVEPAKGPVRPVAPPVDVPDVVVPRDVDVPRAPAKPAPEKAPAGGGIKPTVFIPNPEAPEQSKPFGTAARQEPSVSLEWHGPTDLQVGVPTEYTLVAKNTSATTLYKVVVQAKFPAGSKIAGTDPKAEGSDLVLIWDHGTMAPHQEKAVKISIVPPSKGELLCQAWVTFTGSSSLKVQVREPKLAVAAKGPEKIAVGDPVPLVFSVSNTGDYKADGVHLAINLPAGLEVKPGTPDGVDIGTLAAGETRDVKLTAIARKAGAQVCEVNVEGTGNLKAKATAAVTVLQPMINVEVAGPKLRYLDRKAVYTVKIANPGDAPAAGVVVQHVVPAGFKFNAAEEGGKFDADSRTIKWAVGELAAGETRELKCELVAAITGDFTHKVTAGGDRGLKAETSHATRIDGLSALAMEVVDTEDPVEVGSDTSYEIRVANTGSKDETDVKLVCAIPPQMKFKSARGPGAYEVVGNEVVFEVLKKLPARTEVTFKITVTAKQKGDARFKATMTAGDLTEPVTRQESTRIYAD